MIETLVSDLDGSPAVETIRLGWNGDWREIDLSQRNAAALSRALDRYWTAGLSRPVVERASAVGQRRVDRRSRAVSERVAHREPGVVTDHGEPLVLVDGDHLEVWSVLEEEEINGLCRHGIALRSDPMTMRRLLAQ